GERALKLECNACDRMFQVQFDFRRYHRININIPGNIFHTCTGKEIDDITITSLSVGGVGFVINNDLEAKSGDIYEIKFQLDDEYNSVICEEIVIKRVDSRFVGAEFYPSDRYSHELDFYIGAESWEA